MAAEFLLDLAGKSSELSRVKGGGLDGFLHFDEQIVKRISISKLGIALRKGSQWEDIVFGVLDLFFGE